MKKTYSLKDFHKEVCNLLTNVNPDHVSVRVQIDLFNKVSFHAYMDGFSWYEGDTMEKCLYLMRAAVCPTTLDNPKIDVDIDVENEVIEATKDELPEDLIPF